MNDNPRSRGPALRPERHPATVACPIAVFARCRQGGGR